MQNATYFIIDVHSFCVCKTIPAVVLHIKIVAVNILHLVGILQSIYESIIRQTVPELCKLKKIVDINLVLLSVAWKINFTEVLGQSCK